ncbi:MAG: carboxylesterase/lipase family protein [Myxococcota bacterium]|jgi:para-nitrobenzyl esterase|nr:carboxylesterase/lipase family protein [Myxococcota bacterium]
MGVVIETAGGKIEGEAREGVETFRGIPFAAPPVGARRFCPPAPPEPWGGVRDCTAFGNTAPQPPSLLPGMAPGAQDEDCLYLNVYTPAADTQRRRPVMVWIHGGAFTGGSGSQALYEGAHLVRRGQVVLVTINYRLGALGYLHLADRQDRLEGAASNLGQRDQIAALEWVRDNIDRFGGDPGEVTIFGESAGGMAVSTLLGMPAAKGLFHRVIAQSGAAHATHSATSALWVLDAVLEQLGIAERDIAQLRDVSVERLLAAQSSAALAVGTRVQLPYAPSLDADSLPESPLDVVRRGGAKDIPLIVGVNGDEWKLFSAANPKHDTMDEVVLHKLVRSRLGKQSTSEADAKAMVESYKGTRPEAAPCDLFDAFESDRVFRIPAIRLAEAQVAHQPATRKYYFTYPSPARRGRLGACHALELPFVFGTFDAPTMDRFAGTGPEVKRLSLAMMDAWVAFARSGDPNSEAIPQWAPYCAEQRRTLIFDREVEQRHAPEEVERSAWDGRLSHAPSN